MSTAPLNSLTEKIRATHPGAYDDMDDAELTKRVLAKYPQYSDLAAPAPTAAKGIGGSVAKPAEPEFVNPLPTEKIPMVGPMVQPFGEVGANLAYDPEFAKETAQYGAGSAAVATLPLTAPAIAPITRAAGGTMANHPIASMAGIEIAKQIPGIGPILKKVPGVEWLPLIAGEAPGAIGKLSKMGRAAEAEAIPAVEGAVAKKAATEAAPSSFTPEQNALRERWQARGGSLADKPIDRSLSKPQLKNAAAIPTEAPTAAAIPTEASAAPVSQPKPDVSPQKVGSLLNEGLGGKSLLPNVPLREQVPGRLPPGHSAVESSAIKSYKYDPAAKEFEFVTPSGGVYVHGDVSPDQIAAFEKAASKGKAFNEIKKNSTYVGKIVNGKRLAIKPTSGRSSGDISP